MKIGKFNYKNNLGIILLLAGIAVWLVPFALVAIDNLLNATKPADDLIGRFGLAIITIGPLLFLTGLVLTMIKVIKHLTRS